jgi:uncharacterized protein YraI
MRLGDRFSTILLAVITIILALVVGLVIPLAGGSTLGGKPEPWTPPPTPTSVLPTVTARPIDGAKSASPTTARVQPTATRSTVTTPTVTIAPTSAAVISLTVTLTPIATAPRAQVREGPLALRAGPNQGQPVVSSAQVGQTFTVTGRTTDNTWLQVCCVNNEPAWLASQFVVFTGTLTTLPVKP